MVARSRAISFETASANGKDELGGLAISRSSEEKKL